MTLMAEFLGGPAINCINTYFLLAAVIHFAWRRVGGLMK
jgi:hypothetical protein